MGLMFNIKSKNSVSKYLHIAFIKYVFHPYISYHLM